MMKLIKALAAVVLVTGVAGGGWWVWQWRQETAARQAALSTQLAKADAQLQQLNQEHQALQEAHEALERTQTETEADLRRMNAQSGLLAEQLKAANQDRAASSEELAKITREYERLTQERGTLRERLEQLAAQRDAEAATLKGLEAKLEQLNQAQASAGQERAALEQQVEQSRRQASQLSDRISDVSVAYDQLLSQQLGGAGRRSSRSASVPKPMSPKEKRRQAKVHQDLGEAYWVMELYQKAARELEESLEYRDDAEVHGQLTMLYTHFLHDSDKAAYHLPKAKGARVLSSMPAERPYQLPRNSTSLAQSYLHDQ